VQHHRFATDWVGPLAETSEIDLRFLAWWRIVAEHGDTLATPVGLGQVGQRVATKRRQAGLQPPVVMHPLPDGTRPIDLQSLGDFVVACGQLIPRCAISSGFAKLRTDLCDKRRPTLRWCSGARTVAGLARRADVLPHRVSVQPETLRDGPQRPPGRPMLQHLDHVCHV
jgi:hypothetical protein